MKSSELKRLRIVIRGMVQGVGFRPFIYSLARSMNLNGWVNNSSQGVFIELEGLEVDLDHFLLRIEPEKPSHSFIQSLEPVFLDPVGFEKFEIRESDESGEKSALVLPDIATCPACVREIFDPENRRYLYPFTNCTMCGPRFSIIEKLPYDRKHTTMKSFAMCLECKREYKDPSNRRFHAQPNACPACGPSLTLLNNRGERVATHHRAIEKSIEALRNGLIVALKGIGGYQLLVDARSDSAVESLRLRKSREQKPFAIMAPSLLSASEIAEISLCEKRILLSTEAPIVLLRKKNGKQDFKAVSPDNPTLGIMLPYSPLHHILMKEFNSFLVATSGNRSDEPICTTEEDAFERLADIADLFLTHNRPIVRQVDDSIVRTLVNRELVLRRARGYAPLPLPLTCRAPHILATGAHLKNSFAFCAGGSLFVSQHIGDLDTTETIDAFRREIGSLSSLFDLSPSLIVCDRHPDYFSTGYAHSTGLPCTSVQHHVAHVFACMADNECTPPLLGVSWDGTGYGDDGTIWGGEFFHIGVNKSSRVARLRTFPLPGGEKAVREPRRVAAGILWEVFGNNFRTLSGIPSLKSFSETELNALTTMMEKGVNTPLTSSMGRLFDAVGSIVGLRQITGFEGQTAMALEFSLDDSIPKEYYPMKFDKDDHTRIIDWEPMIREIVNDMIKEYPVSLIAAKFHNTLVNAVLTVALEIGEKKVLLTGGCFQNRYLTERAVTLLRQAGFDPYWHQRIPPNDGGISAGQVASVLFTSGDKTSKGR